MSVITVRRISNAQVARIKKQKSQEIKEQIQVQVYTDKDGKSYVNPTYVYVLPSKKDDPIFKKRMIPVYRSTVSNFSVSQVIPKTISTSNVIKFY